MKGKISLLSIILVIMLLFSACSKNDSNVNKQTDIVADNSNQETVKDDGKDKDTSEDGSKKEQVTITYLYPLSGDYLRAVDNLNDSLVIQKMEKITNVHMEFIHPPAGQEAEQFNLMVASDDLPDMVTHGMGMPDSYPGGGDKAIKDGKYLALNDLVESHAPNFKKIIDSDDELRKDILTDEGNIWGLPMIDKTAQTAFTGPIVRKDWMDELALKEPKTIDDWYQILKTFKDKKGVEVPFIIPSSGIPADDAFIGAYGISSSFYQIDNKIKFGPIEPEYKEYLTEMNKWYNEGLIDKDFPAWDNDKTVQYMTTGKAAAIASGFWVFEPWETASEDSNMKLMGVGYPALKEGEKPHLRQNNRRMRGYFTAITTKCKHPERAMEWMDYFYSDDGFILANYGIEGKTFEKKDGEYQYTDLMLNNPEGVPPEIAFVKYAYSHGAFLRDWRREDTLFPKDALAACDVWDESADNDYMLPPIKLTAEEGEEFSQIMGDINTYIGEKRLDFIMGNESFDKFDEYVQQVKKMNIDKAIELQQKALDRYNVR
ncbi:extracellular solute-binding protein [Xylanivirga thermophila]|uniref:extracellular solute-binding protein n=1 Tax=Xylanivirga thermophila TaxID=2496273 RepID=UPI00101E1839|nr:extracellular solute-binding protein [Xylanivirga thermophila]